MAFAEVLHSKALEFIRPLQKEDDDPWLRAVLQDATPEGSGQEGLALDEEEALLDDILLTLGCSYDIALDCY